MKFCMIWFNIKIETINIDSCKYKSEAVDSTLIILIIYQSKRVNPYMSHLGHIESQATKDQAPKIQAWAKYEAAQVQFDKYRKKLIHSIMEIKNQPGMDFFTELHKRIDHFNNHEIMDRIARSVTTGEALEEIHVKYVDQNVHQEKSISQVHEPAHNVPQWPTIEEQIDKQGLFTNEQRAREPEHSEKQTEISVIESKIQDPIPAVQQSIETQENPSEALPQSQANETVNQSPSIQENPVNSETPEVTPALQPETTQISQPKEEASPIIEEVEPVEVKSENPQENSQQSTIIQVPVQAPQEVLQAPEEAKQSIPKEQALTEQEKVELKVEAKNEPEKQEKTEVKEEKPEQKQVKEEAQEKQKQEPQKEQPKTEKKKKKNKKK